jgi:hypothetical protein
MRRNIFAVPPSVCASALVFFLCLCVPAPAQWSTDPKVNNAICTTANQQKAPRVVTDGSGGAIISWWDLNLSTPGYNIYAQRIDSVGIVRWTANGAAICTGSSIRQNPEMTSDGNGGAIIAWQDNRSGGGDIYTQRIDSSGLVQWTVDGIPVCADPLDQTSPQLISDGSGGAILTWQDLRDGANYMPYAQRINASGIAQWKPNGVLLSTTGTAETPQLLSDGSSGAIIAWHSYTGVYPNGNFDIEVQRIDANGQVGWGINGVALCTLPSDQLRPQLVSDSSGGAIVIWEDYRNGPTYSNLYAQKVNAGGVVQWTLDGVAIAPNTIHQLRHKMLGDGGGGAFVAWQYSSINSVYAQRIDSGGFTRWGRDGLSIGSAGDSRYPQITTDGRDGAIITWYDYRGSGNGDIFAQRVDSAGTVLWAANGVGVCRDPGGQVFPRLVETADGGAIITWEDGRNIAVTSTDIYAQQISAAGILGQITGVSDVGGMPKEYALLQNYPNPFNPSTTIKYELSKASRVELGMYDMLGREVSRLVDDREEAGAHEVKFDGASLSSGVYFYRLRAGNFVQTHKLLLLR